MKNPARAFTTVELLTVIGVIAILSALLFPTLGKAKRSALMIKSQSNLRQIGAVVQVYVADTGNYPHGSDAGFQWGQPAGKQIEATWRGYWSDILSPYLNLNSYWGDQTSPIFDSPAKLIKTPKTAVAFTPNPQIIQDTEWGWGNVVPALQVQRKSSVILLGDGVQNPIYGGSVCNVPWQQKDLYDTDPNNAEEFIQPVPNVDDGSNTFRFRYENRGHFLFCDGHVELIENGKLQKKNFAINY